MVHLCFFSMVLSFFCTGMMYITNMAAASEESPLRSPQGYDQVRHRQTDRQTDRASPLLLLRLLTLLVLVVTLYT